MNTHHPLSKIEYANVSEVHIGPKAALIIKFNCKAL